MSKTLRQRANSKNRADADFYAEGFECGNRWGSEGPADRRLALIEWLQSKSGQKYNEFLESEADRECVGWVALAVVVGGPNGPASAGPAGLWETAIGGSEAWRGDRITRAAFLRGFCDGALSSRMNV